MLIEVEELREQNRQLALEVNRLGLLILAERDRADRMIVYEKQNISLREEISRNHGDVRKEAPTNGINARHTMGPQAVIFPS